MQNPKPPQSRSPVLRVSIILGITFLCYILAFFNDFVNYDDPLLLFDNVIIHNLSFGNVLHVFRSIWEGHYSRFNPLVFVAYMIVHHFAGFNPFWFHAVNIFFHLGTTVVVFYLAKEITQKHRLSFICALLFGIHPIHAEPVAWISGLTHVMYTFFYLLCVYLYYRALNHKPGRSFLFGLSFFVFVVAGTCFSGGVVTLPVILLLLTCFRFRTLSKQTIVRLIPFCLLALYFIYLTIYTAKNADIISNPYFNTAQHSLMTRINLSVVSIMCYLGQIIFPYSFTFEHPQGYFLPFASIWATLFFAVFLVLLLVNRGRFLQLRYFTLGFLFFLIAIAPFLKLYATSTSIINDRYAYLASFGLFLLLAEMIDILIAQSGPRSNWFKIALAGGFFYLTVITGATILNWRNGEHLWGQLIKTYPRAYPAYLGRADYFIRQKDYRKALEDCEKALFFNPQDEDTLSLKGIILINIQLYDQAVSVFSELLGLNPRHFPTLNNRGAAYLLLGNHDLAILDFSQSIRLDAKQVDPYYNRGIGYLQKRQYAAALKDFQNVLDKQPANQLAKEKIEEIETLLTVK